ncbi:MAG: RNA-binding transcriptional accessory protein [Leadbetterella sp.]|nr:RNA-binding transcriptional accessory protein [Leadbetterella sp.]
MRSLNYIAETLKISTSQVSKTVALLDSGATVPFIARYRKEVTGSLDEVAILEIRKIHEKLKEADKRRVAILESIDSQGKLTPELRKKLEEALFVQELEEIYLPYRPKKKTRASVAVEAGLEPLARLLFEQKERFVEPLAARYLNGKITTVEEALAGARDIMAEWISEDAECRKKVRNLFEKSGVLEVKVKKGKDTEGQKFKDYFDYSEAAKNIPSHRYLAIRRGEEEGFLKVGIGIDNEEALEKLGRGLLRGMPESKEQVELALEDSLKRLMLPALEKEYDNALKDKADKAAITIFTTNLRQLLLSPPMGQKRVMGIDPGFRTGCKVVVLDEQGNLKEDEVIYPQGKSQEAEAKLQYFWNKYKTEVVAIGNGTAGRETEQFVKEIIRRKPEFKALKVVMVSEQGASVYSASEVAREEFPHKDITVRGAVSIARRLMDPLAELVKIDPKSIGVGQYQHDVNQKELKESLDTVVESCVNLVGVELNTASKHLLSYVSGIGPSIAQNIVDYRAANGQFRSRKELKKVPRLGEKVFEQAAGFLRIHGAENPLDNSAVHPESYGLVEKMAKDLKTDLKTFLASEEIQKQVEVKRYVSGEVGMPTLQDILQEIRKPGRDPREPFESVEFADVNAISDLRTGMVLPGVVTNITAFGCFVDIGVHQDGLVHLSNLANRFVRDPNEVVKVHQKVMVKVLEVDERRKRIGLSMKEV